MAAPSSSSEVPFGTSLAPFSPTKILRFERGGKLVVIQGRIGSAAASASPTATTAASASATVTAAAAASAPPPNADSGAPAILQLEQRAVCGNPSIFLDSLPSFSVALTNHSGAEYSYYEARGLNAVFDAEVIWPASARQIARKTPAVTWMCEESAALYQQVVAQHAQEQAANAVWLEAVVKLEKERERNLFANDRFIINVDTKWKTHGPLTEDATVRVGWCGAPWTADLYLLAIVADPALKSIRDLRGEAGRRFVPKCSRNCVRWPWRCMGWVPGNCAFFFTTIRSFIGCTLTARDCRSTQGARPNGHICARQSRRICVWTPTIMRKSR